MIRRKILASALVAAGMLSLTQGTAEAAIVCDGDFQVVNGYPVATPYCREMTLARVARSYGWRVSDETIRHNESVKAQVCRAIGFDNRVQEICAPFNGDSGSTRRLPY
jgi:hypothetical protein